MSPGVWVVLAVLVAASGFGVWRARTDGRFRGTSEPWSGESTPLPEGAAEPTAARGAAAPTAAHPGAVLAGDHELGDRATLLQFSSAFCAPCRATRRVLADIAEVVPGVTHVEIDAEQHLETVRRLEVHRTPTTLVLDAEGREVSRAVGAPRKEQVLAALARIVG
jgi:thiol-disulfide isomerase/thioredoxin